MKVIKVLIVTIFCILLLVVLAKPGFNRFKQFSQDYPSPQYKTVNKKTGDYLIWAEFESLTYRQNEYHKLQYDLISKNKYVGYLLNFHKVK